MTLEEKLINYALAAGRAQNAGARARESGSREDWRRYAETLEDLAKALADYMPEKKS
jgi:biotin synthase-related radical SAM superfamily protein